MSIPFFLFIAVRPSAKYLPGGKASGLIFSFSRVSHFLRPSSVLGLFTLGFFYLFLSVLCEGFLAFAVTHPIFWAWVGPLGRGFWGFLLPPFFFPVYSVPGFPGFAGVCLFCLSYLRLYLVAPPIPNRGAQPFGASVWVLFGLSFFLFFHFFSTPVWCSSVRTLAWCTLRRQLSLERGHMCSRCLKRWWILASCLPFSSFPGVLFGSRLWTLLIKID